MHNSGQIQPILVLLASTNGECKITGMSNPNKEIEKTFTSRPNKTTLKTKEEKNIGLNVVSRGMHARIARLSRSFSDQDLKTATEASTTCGTEQNVRQNII